MTTDKPARSRKRTLLLITVALLAGCLVLSAITSLFSDDPPAAPDVTEEPLPTATSEPPPTNTPEPPPTATSEPAPTDPPPTATTTPTEAPDDESAETLAYRASILEIAELYQTGLEGLGTQSSAVGVTPSLIIDDEWKITTAAYLAAIRVANDQVFALDPPDQLREVHNELLTAAGHFDTMTTLYAEGVDEISADKLTGALEAMQLGSEAVQRATALLGALN